MAEKITMDRLRNVVRLLNTMTGNAYDFSLDSAFNGYRLVRKQGSVDVSPRMKKTELYYWVHAFRDGVMLGEELKGGGDALQSLKRLVPWVGKMIADGGHLESVAPNTAVKALAEAEKVIARAEGRL